MMLYSCLSEEGVAIPRKLKRNGWTLEAHRALCDLIQNNGKQNSKYDPECRPYAVFDCDNTTVAGDLQETLFLYQLMHLTFGFSDENVTAVLATGIPNLDLPLQKAGQTFAPARTVIQDCAEDYRYLKKYLQDSVQIRQTVQYQDFKAKLLFLYAALSDTFSDVVSYTWILYVMFAGLSVQATRNLAKQAYAWKLEQTGFYKKCITSPKVASGKAGVVTAEYRDGLAFPEEMKDLFHTLLENGIDVYICSASLQEIVEAALTDPQSGYGLGKEHIFGMRLKTDESGRYLPAYADAYPKIQREGKTELINRYILPAHGGRGPVLVAGDSAGDVAMLTAYSDTQLGLLMCPDGRRDIAGLLKAERTDGLHYVLQDRWLYR
ncbi:haloacid dehalogenase-like hydrolase [Ructibacterium gallinarum]|uniref:phosphoserine phosphatase n=1 Tax=Ructibacterium gallinarum TaxID=2779355 RepID=A0A9D5RA38_9FIRM|nr:haloacid dehalogenase-like hydrolase [Ructibacterium gallinarum]MBE5041109.1 haloacid dehalogenase-like hydrolase [Ructibacterium gallinarum]